MVDLVKMLSHRKGDASNYRPTAGTRCLISGPNCDDEKGYTYGEYCVLWSDDLFVVYRKDDCWPVIHKWEHIIAKPLAESLAAPAVANAAMNNALPMDEISRHARLGAHIFDFAKQAGWKDDGEGAFEFIQRQSYAVGIEDAGGTPPSGPRFGNRWPIDLLEAATAPNTAVMLTDEKSAASDALDKPVVAMTEPFHHYGMSAEQVQQLLDGSLKPEEISGAEDVQHDRVRELVWWFDRFTRGEANPKWATRHACELAYFIATNGINRHIDLKAVRDAAFKEGVNITPEERGTLERIGFATPQPAAAGPDAKLVEALKLARNHLDWALDGHEFRTIAGKIDAALAAHAGQGAKA